MVMVKAFSYGLGTYEVAKVLEENKVDYLGVANIYEGIELRKSGIKLPIMVMKPEVESFDLMIEFQLTPAIFSMHSLNLLISRLIRKPFNISLKFDTGMHRLGFDPTEIDALIELLKQHTNLKIESIFSHLAASDEAEHDEFTNKQIETFTVVANQITSNFTYPIDRHILNTNGIIRFNNAQMEMVRLGIGLYGICADKLTQQKLLPVSTLKSKISQIKHIPKGDTIGYNRKGKAPHNLKIATIPVGYADGLSRLLGNRNWNMLVHGKKAPIVGNVCMDMVMIDITNINCEEGDEVFVFSSENPIPEMAKTTNMISYELLTSYSPRVKRVFKT
jgi:alanine racemase